jgi:hypothetical protein
MAELFIKQAENYADGRPSYPQELFQFIASKTPSHDLAWDVGTGNGQAARSVSFHFSFPLTNWNILMYGLGYIYIYIRIYIYIYICFFFFCGGWGGILYRVFEV